MINGCLVIENHMIVGTRSGKVTVYFMIINFMFTELFVFYHASSESCPDQYSSTACQ